MNAMLYVRGRPLDYDLWEKAGAEGWGWQSVLPYFMRSEDNARGASEFHGSDGPLIVSEQRSPRRLNADITGCDLSEALLAVARERAGDLPRWPFSARTPRSATRG